MIKRKPLEDKIKLLLNERPIVWLSGVRRVGKTTLCKAFLDAAYYDCELPSVRAQLEDIEFFWAEQKSQLIIMDEVHRLTDPSSVLKIAADHFPGIKIIATGSSTLAARRKFKDTLTDRKRDVWVQPFLVSEVQSSASYSLDRRLLLGGLPPAFLEGTSQDRFYGEWLDSFWSKDVQELFAVEKKTSFLKLAELILRQSGEIFEASSFASPCEISRQTVQNYLEILATTLFAIVVRPYSKHRANDIISAPKVYGFDTGFVCFARGWEKLRNEDRGNLIEHLVLSELLSTFGKNCVYYWRDKQKHEIDFLVKPLRGNQVHTVECKANYLNFSPRNLSCFRRAYPEGKNFLYAGNVKEPFLKKFGDHPVQIVPLHHSLTEFL